MSEQASPKPWAIRQTAGKLVTIVDATGRALFVVQNDFAGPIVRAVNAYDKVQTMTDALEKIAELQTDKCGHASVEMLLTLLVIKVDIARDALAIYKADLNETA